MKHVLAAPQFEKSELLQIMKEAKSMEEILTKKGHCEMAKGKIMAALFYEPSTRTRLSFETAMLRLGGSIISETDVTFSSITKGEKLSDTIEMVAGYADIIAMRSKNVGDAQIAADTASVPVLNAGDGAGEHPTQALLDLYTIQKYFDLKKELTVSFVGDLKYGRTVHSLCTILRNFPNVQINFVAPEVTQIPDKYFQTGDKKHLDLSSEILENSDVIYDTRIQKERFENPSDYELVKDAFVFDTEKVNQMADNAILMHPLPRINEITTEVDALPQAKYFEQARNGVPIRMALIARALELI
jgi:aspartate carbamoyltransferase catalytic subunit